MANEKSSTFAQIGSRMKNLIDGNEINIDAEISAAQEEAAHDSEQRRVKVVVVCEIDVNTDETIEYSAYVQTDRKVSKKSESVGETIDLRQMDMFEEGE